MSPLVGGDELAGLALNRAPVPVAEAMFGMQVARVLMAGVRLGVFAELARAPAAPDELARTLGLDPAGTQRLLDCLRALGHLRRRSDARLALSRRARRWLDPASPLYVGTFLEFNYDQWEWWSSLEERVRSGQAHEIHHFEPGDPRWRRYITGLYELARVSAPEVARRLRLAPRPRRLLDLAGGHGWFAAEACRRHPGLRATVLDLPGSVAIGREIIARAGMAGRVDHAEGDLGVDDLGGPWDAVLAFQIVHHLTPEQNVALLRRIHDALAPGGTVAVLDYFVPAKPDQRPDASAFLGLHFWLTSAAATYRVADLHQWLAEAGFASLSRATVRRVPGQTLVQARRRPGG